jgi:CDP-glycerol glycerophosphotransferase
MNTLKDGNFDYRKEATYIAGTDYEEQKDWARALVSYDEAAADNPHVSEYYFRRGICLIHLRKWQEAEDSFRSALQLNESQAEYYNKLAVALQWQGKKADEAEALVSGIMIDPRHASWHSRLGEAYLELKNWPGAEAAFNEAISRKGNVSDHFGGLARALHEQGKYESEIVALDKAISLDETKEEWRQRMIIADKKLNESLIAEELFESAKEYLTLGKAIVAVESLRKAIQINAKSSKYFDVLASALNILNDTKEEEKALASAIKLNPENALLHARAGRLSVSMKRYQQAIQAFKKAVELNPVEPLYLHELAGAYRQANNRDAEIATLLKAIAINSLNSRSHYELGEAYMAKKDWPRAESAFYIAIEHDNTDAAVYNRLAEALRPQKRWWQELDALKEAVSRDDRHASWHFRLGEVNEILGNLEEAAQCYLAAVKRDGQNGKYHFRLGYALERIDFQKEATAAYAEAIRIDKTQISHTFGLGVFHQNDRNWKAAAKEYLKQTKVDPMNGELYYRLGFAYDRCYDWSKAKDAYSTALSIDPSNADWHYRLGYVHERLLNFQTAGQAYAYAATTRSKHTPYWYYRLGYVLCSNQKFEEACAAFIEMRTTKELEVSGINSITDTQNVDVVPLPAQRFVSSINEYLSTFSRVRALSNTVEIDATQPDIYFEIGNEYEKNQEWASAAEAYKSAVARKNDHMPVWYYRLGYVLTQAGRFIEACEAFKNFRPLRAAHGLSEDGYKKDKELKKVTDYTEYYENFEVDPNVVVYESFHGNSMSCNPYAIFLELLSREDFQGYTHVWVINDRDRISNRFHHLKNVIFVQKESDLYLRYLASAGILINNSTFPAYFIRKPDQIYLNTWHGTPWKTLGSDMKGRVLEHKTFTRNIFQSTHLISPNEHTTEILATRHEIQGTYNGLLAETGYPRIDLTLNMSAEAKKALRISLGIKKDEKVILYAPTWRGVLGEVEFDSGKLLNDLAAMMATGYRILFRGHSLMESIVASLDISDCLVPSSIDSNELLSVVDVLVTDYSSIAFDFMVTGRPIIYYVYDLDEYVQERGLYFSMDIMPGEKVSACEELIDAIERAVEEPVVSSSCYSQAQKAFLPYEDGQSSARVVDMIFNNDTSGIKTLDRPSKTSLLFYGGPFMPNGITTSYLNLLSHIDSSKYAITIAVDAHAVTEYEERMEQFSRLPDHIQKFGRSGRMNMTLEERSIVELLNQKSNLLTDEMWALYYKAHEREYRRLFGEAKFDVLVNFEGYVRFWATLFAVGNADGKQRNAIYQHNDKYSEWTQKYPYLEAIFRMYPQYDAVIGVSKQTKELNEHNLADLFNLDRSRLDFCDNVQNPERALALAEEELENPEDAELFESSRVFLTMGRLSMEKDHKKLITAFSEIVVEYPDTKLVILGDGPLRHLLVHHIAELGLNDSVHLLGRRSNPFPYLKKAECFVLSSNHEGQPMVLLEAMILGKPIVSTDITGSRSVLTDHPFCLFPNNVEGLAQGMRSQLEGRLNVPSFEYRKYQAAALNMFYSKVIGERAAKKNTRRKQQAVTVD